MTKPNVVSFKENPHQKNLPNLVNDFDVSKVKVNACLDSIDRVGMTAGKIDVKPETLSILVEFAKEHLKIMERSFLQMVKVSR